MGIGDGPQSHHVHNVIGAILRLPCGRVRSHHCPSITSHAVQLQQWFSVIVVVAVAADWSWQNQTLERLGEFIFVAEALGRCIFLATCT